MITDEEMKCAFSETNTSEPLAEEWPGLERYGRAIEKLVENRINVSNESIETRVAFWACILGGQIWCASSVSVPMNLGLGAMLFVFAAILRFRY